jgi:hypothetical protein
LVVSAAFAWCAIACEREAAEVRPLRPAVEGGRRAEATPSAQSSSSPRAVVPRLEGRYRVDATLGLNPQGIAANGGERVYVLESIRAAVESGFLVKGRVSWVFGGSSLTLRAEVLVRSADGAYVWQYCEGAGNARWQDDELIVPSEIRAKARAGVFTKARAQAAPCAASIPAGAYRLQAQGTDIVLQREDAGARLGYLLVRDESLLDVEQEAQQLSGFEELPR